jgi:hypothetical protein
VQAPAIPLEELCVLRHSIPDPQGGSRSGPSKPL